MAAELLLYGVKGSPFVRKVEVFLAEKGLAFDIEAVMPFPAPDWFVQLNPAKRIPVLRDRSVGTEGPAGTLPDSSVICAYLERKQPSPALYPQDAWSHARALWYEEFADSELAARIGAGIFRPLVLSRLFGREPDLATARKTLSEDLPPHFDYLEREVEGREFLLDGIYSIADIAVASQFVNLLHAGARVDATRWPGLAAYLSRLHARPSFAACIVAERKVLPKVEALD